MANAVAADAAALHAALNPPPVPPTSIDTVGQFVLMLMPALEAVHRTPAFIHQFLIEFSRMQISSPFLNFIGQRMQEIPEASRAALVDSGHAGTYGRIYFCGLSPRVCYKAIFLQNDNIDEHTSETLKEAFIQYIIGSDISRCTPRLLNIYKSIYVHPNGTSQIVIMLQMERSGISLTDYFAGLPRPISFANFYQVTYPLFTLLQNLFNRYRFVHRDFKTNNVLLNPLAAGFHIIDFGMSCITINVGGQNFLIKPSGIYDVEIPCRQQQDVLLYIVEFATTFEGQYDARVGRLFDYMLTPPVRGQIVAKAGAEGLSIFHASYNTNDRILGEDIRQRMLSIWWFLRAMNSINTGLLHGGRRRPKTKKRTRK